MAESKISQPIDISKVVTYMNLGNMSGSNGKEAMINAYKAMSNANTGKVVCGIYGNTGVWFFVGYAYPSEYGGDYGGMIAVRYDGPFLQLSDNNGTYIVYNISKQQFN